MENNNQISYAKTMSEAESMACDIVRKNNSKMRDKSNETIKQEGFVFNSNKEEIVRKALDHFIKYAIDKKIEFTLENSIKGEVVPYKWIIEDGNMDKGLTIEYVGKKPDTYPRTGGEHGHYFAETMLKYIINGDFDEKRNYQIEADSREISYKRAVDKKFKKEKYVVLLDNDDNINDLKIPKNISLICVGNGERVKTEENDSPEKNEKVEKSNSVTYGRNILLYGAPGTGKSHTAQQIVKNNAKDDKTCKELKLDNMPAGKSVRVTFHPDTDYASFVGCYKPSMNGKEIEYKFVPQAFLRIYVDAWKSLILKEKKQYYLIIEELNRGNCAQIFGDIFQLLDRDDNGYSEYYILADTDVVKYLKSEEGFGNNYENYCGELKDLFEDLKKDDNKDWDVLALPSNLTILATMNTSDQSLFPIDSAFKRRWEWKYVRINYDAVDLKDVKLWNGTTKWLDFIEAINTYIADKTHSADKQIGERFVKPKDSKIDYETFRDKVMFYLFNDVFKDDESFGKDVFEDENGIHLFGDLTEENAKEFIKNKLLVQ